MLERFRNLAVIVVVAVLTACGTGDETGAHKMVVTEVTQSADWQALAAYVTWIEGTAAAHEALSVERMPQPATSPAAVPSSLAPCGGDLPPCTVKANESGGDYTAVNPTGCGGRSCGGAWQFDPKTWNGYGGYAYAQDAPPEVQDAKARELWADGAGCSHWGACG